MNLDNSCRSTYKFCISTPFHKSTLPPSPIGRPNVGGAIEGWDRAFCCGPVQILVLQKLSRTVKCGVGSVVNLRVYFLGVLWHRAWNCYQGGILTICLQLEMGTCEKNMKIMGFITPTRRRITETTPHHQVTWPVSCAVSVSLCKDALLVPNSW